MLRRFLYLNEASLDSYIGVVEGGLSDQMTRRRGAKGTKGGEGGLSAKVVSGKVTGQREHSEEDESVVRDAPEIRFDRLMAALEADPDAWGYEEILDLSEAFDRLPIGTLVTVDCEIEIPPLIRMLAQPNELNQFLDLMEVYGPLAAVFGGSTENMPSSEQVQAARAFSQFKADLVIVGEVDEDTPRLAGKLDQNFVREMPEGEARVVGKVARKWKEGEQYSLMSLPGATLMNRSQRRKAVPVDPNDENVLHGPAITLDVLAVYR